VAEDFLNYIDIGDDFNPIAESQKLGADRQEEKEDQGDFAERCYSRSALAGVELRWKEVLTNMRPFDNGQMTKILLRRYVEVQRESGRLLANMCSSDSDFTDQIFTMWR
jgi:hypothetical protein